MQVGLGPGHIVRWGPSSPPLKGTAPQFSAHICCGQLAAWIKMSLGMELGLVPCDFVLDGDPASLPQNGAEPPSPIFGHFYCGQAAGCIKMPLGTDVGLSPGDFVLDGDTIPSPKRGRNPPNFQPMFIVVKWLDASRWHLAWRWASAQVTLC